MKFKVKNLFKYLQNLQGLKRDSNMPQWIVLLDEGDVETSEKKNIQGLI